jgi:uncharacterized protein YaaQ
MKGALPMKLIIAIISNDDSYDVLSELTKAGFDAKTLAAQIKAECAVYCRCNADVQNVKELAI